MATYPEFEELADPKNIGNDIFFPDLTCNFRPIWCRMVDIFFYAHCTVHTHTNHFFACSIESKYGPNRIFSSIFISHARTAVRIRIQITNNLKICFECEENIRNAGKVSCLSGDTHSIDLLHGAYTNLVFCDDIKETQNNCAIEYIVENWVCLRCRCRYT